MALGYCQDHETSGNFLVQVQYFKGLIQDYKQNKDRTFVFFWGKIDLKLGGHYACQMIEIVYKGFTIIKKTKWARQQLHSIVFVCRKGWSKYWFCLYIVVFWTRSLLYYLAAFASIYLWALARTTDAKWSLFSWKSQTFWYFESLVNLFN